MKNGGRLPQGGLACFSIAPLFSPLFLRPLSLSLPLFFGALASPLPPLPSSCAAVLSLKGLTLFISKQRNVPQAHARPLSDDLMEWRWYSDQLHFPNKEDCY